MSVVAGVLAFVSEAAAHGQNQLVAEAPVGAYGGGERVDVALLAKLTKPAQHTPDPAPI